MEEEKRVPRIITNFFRHAFNTTRYDVAAVLLVSLITCFDINSDGKLLSFSIGVFTITFSHFLMFSLGLFFGYADVSFATLILVGFSYYHDFSLSYNSIVFLLVGLMGYHFSRRRLFRKKLRYLLPFAPIVMSLLVGNGWYLVTCLLTPVGFSQVSLIGQVFLFLLPLPEFTAAILIAYFFFTRAKRETLEKIYCGFFFYEEYEEFKKKRKGKGSVLARNMMIGLILNLAVIVSSSIYIAGRMLSLSTVLGPVDGYQKDIRISHEEGVLHDIEKLKEYKKLSDATGEVIEGSRMGAYNNAFSFGLELGFMLVSVIVPMILLTYYAFQRITVRPIGILSSFIRGYAEAKEEDRISYYEEMEKFVPEVKDDISDIYNATGKMMRDITEYIETQRKEKELESELIIAKQANEAKTNFLSNMSHEIRTPINSILGMNEMILRESTESTVKNYADNIKESGANLLRIVNDILDLSRIEAGKMQIQPRQYDFTSTVNNLISMVDVQAEDKGLKLEINVNPNIPSVLFGDEKRIVQCVTNILSNAVKYTLEGRIALTIDFNKESENEIALSFMVKDTGIGIKKEDLDRLFSPYERIEEKKNYNIEGTGLGMDIVKSLLAMMNSHLTVHSVYGEGSSFSFAVFQQVIQWEPIGDVKERYRRNNGDDYKYRESFQAPGARILVVDDTSMNLIVIKGLLKQTRVRIDTADSGKEALKMVQKNRYDIIFIDHRMPGMDGIETHRHMVSDFENPNRFVPCIALTANAISGAREMYLAEGFQDYLAKPISAPRLENMIIKYLPRDMVYYPDDPLFDKDPVEEKKEEEKDPFADTDMSLYEGLDGINIKIAMKNCDRPEILKEAFSEFLFTINTHSNALEKYVNSGDIRNFTIAVHALKSNSRLIGAMKLSGVAETMEDLGNNGDMEAIKERLPQLLSLYRSYEEKLSPIAKKEEEESGELKEISEEEFKGALSDMRELIEVFDYDNASSIMHMLSEYKVPFAYEKKWIKIKELMAAVDLEGLLNELE